MFGDALAIGSVGDTCLGSGEVVLVVGVLNVNEELACPFNLFIRARCYRSFSAARVSIPVMIWLLLRSRVSTFETRRSLALENLALRQQLAVLQRSVKRSRLSNLDRGLWVLLRRFWTDWAKVFVIVKPDTVVRWHRAGFRRYWAWRSRRLRPGRPCVAPEIRELIRNMCWANPLWGAPRACTAS